MNALGDLGVLLAESSDPGNPPAELIRRLMESVNRIAVVGLSRDPAKAARRVPSYLAAKGYDVVPVNPFAERILGRKSFPRLSEVEGPVDMVLVFRPSADAGAIVSEAARRPERPAIWLQEGIRADTEAASARAAGQVVVQDLCAFKAHRAVIG